MSKRSEMVIIVYTISLVLLAFCQFAHEAGWDLPTDSAGATAPARPMMIASGVSR